MVNFEQEMSAGKLAFPATILSVFSEKPKV